MEKINSKQHKTLTTIHNIFCNIVNFMNYYNIMKLLHSLMILMELFKTTGLSQSFHFGMIGLEQKIKLCQIVK